MDCNRRRIAEEERKRRIFNAKWRQIGVDVDALNHQVHEKMMDRRREEERERAYAEENKRQSILAELMEQEKNEQLLKLNQKDNEYRRYEQRPEYRREFHLNDPDFLKKERPPRPSDDFESPLSSLQKFLGEDLEGKKRTKAQKAQFRDLLLQQMHEKRLQNFKNDKAKQEWESIMLQHDSFAQQVAKMGEDYNREMKTSLSDQNKWMASKMKEMDLQDRMKEDIEKKKEIYFQLNSDLLTESPFAARSSFGPNRVVPDRWKGMTKEQLMEIREGQRNQMAENRMKREQENLYNTNWDEMMKNQDTVSKLCEDEENERTKEKCKRMVAENHYLAQEQKEQKDFLDKVVYANTVSKDYYDQFNTSSR